MQNSQGAGAEPTGAQPLAAPTALAAAAHARKRAKETRLTPSKANTPRTPVNRGCINSTRARGASAAGAAGDNATLCRTPSTAGAWARGRCAVCAADMKASRSVRRRRQQAARLTLLGALTDRNVRRRGRVGCSYYVAAGTRAWSRLGGHGRHAWGRGRRQSRGGGAGVTGCQPTLWGRRDRATTDLPQGTRARGGSLTLEPRPAVVLPVASLGLRRGRGNVCRDARAAAARTRRGRGPDTAPVRRVSSSSPTTGTGHNVNDCHRRRGSGRGPGARQHLRRRARVGVGAVIREVRCCGEGRRRTCWRRRQPRWRGALHGSSGRRGRCGQCRS